MKTKLITVLLALIALVAGTAETNATRQSVLRQSGECKIQRGKSADQVEFPVALKNSDVEIACKFRADDFVGRDVVLANPTIANVSGRDLSVAYHVAFFDKAGELIGSASQEGEVPATAKRKQFGSCIITVPQSEVPKISSYRICVYVNDVKAKN